MRRVWKPALAAANLHQELGTHSLRRSQVALLIAEGEHPKVIATASAAPPSEPFSMYMATSRC